MQWIDRATPDRASDIDMMRALVEAISQELWKLCGGGRGAMNWEEVERNLSCIVEQARHDARHSWSVLVTVAANSGACGGAPKSRGEIEIQGGRL